MIRTLTPEQISQYRSQWARYERALEITPIQLRYQETTRGLFLDVRFYNEPSNDNVNQLFDHRITARLVGEEQIKVFTGFVAEIDGNEVDVLGEYVYYDGGVKIEVLEGNYVIVSPEGRSVGLVSADRHVIVFGEEKFREILNKGQTIGYRCSCTDYMGQFNSMVRGHRQWKQMGSLGLCKHIMAVKLQRKEPLALFTDIPMVTAKPKYSTVIKGGKRGTVKGVGR